MKCAHCEYEYEFKYNDTEGKGDEEFFSMKGKMRRETYTKKSQIKETMEVYGCPKCFKVFMG